MSVMPNPERRKAIEIKNKLKRIQAEKDHIKSVMDAFAHKLLLTKKIAIEKMKQVIHDNNWLDQPGFKFDGRVGYSHGCFGVGGNFTSTIRYTIHDMAHAIVCVEIDEIWRLFKEDFDLTIKRQIIHNGTNCDRPITLQATKMEARTVAIQRHLYEALGIEIQPNFYNHYAALLINEMPDADADLFEPAGYAANINAIPYGKTRFTKRVGFIKTWYEKTNIERIKLQWQQVCEIINNKKTEVGINEDNSNV